MQLTSLLCSAILATTFCADPAERPRPKITISKETTYITEPIGEDGYVDYQAALNARLGKGVTPENNAAVLLLKAFGTKVIDEPIRKKTLELMGAKDLTEEGDGFVTLEDFMQKNHPGEDLKGDEVGENAVDKIDSQEEEALSRPWSKDEFPRLTEWLRANEAALKTIEEASKRERFFIPAVSVKQVGLTGCVNVGLMEIRQALRALRMRAMNFAQSNRIEEAWGDALIIYRIAKLQSQAPYMTGALMATAYSGIAYDGMNRLALAEKLSPEQAKRYLTEVDRIPIKISLPEVFDFSERIYVLDSIRQEAVYGRKELSPEMELWIGLVGSKDRFLAVKNLLDNAEIDWSEVLHIVNVTFDAAVKANALETYQEKKAAVKIFSQSLAQQGKTAYERIASRDFDPKTATSQDCAAIYASIQTESAFKTLSSAITVVPVRLETNKSITSFSLALAGYHAEHGAYPKELGALAPEYFSELPKDSFSGGDFIYRAEGTGYVLYSVGPNGKDDGGRNFSDTTSENPIPEDADDIAIRKK